MADREMIAATLAAALLAGRTFSSGQLSTEEIAVETYRKVLAALASSTSAAIQGRRRT